MLYVALKPSGILKGGRKKEGMGTMVGSNTPFSLVGEVYKIIIWKAQGVPQ